MADRSAGSSTTWLTDDELTFVRGVGTYTDGVVKGSRLTWLQRYIEAIEYRIDWGTIDKAMVLKEATRLLRVEQRREVVGSST